MKKYSTYLSFSFLFLLTSNLIFAQLADYKLTSSSGSFTANSGSATSVSSVHGDDLLSNGIPIGFTFKFDTTNYTHIKASSNGWLTFDTTKSPSTLFNRLNALINNPGARPLIAPLWDNLDGTTGSASYETTGTSPNRVFTFEWKNWKWDLNATSAVISFQAKLYETSNKIQFVYKQESGNLVSNSSGASIGFSAVNTGAGNFLSLNNSSSSPTVSTTTETTSISTKPATGQIYSFEKGGCSSPINIKASNVNRTSADISFEQPKHVGDSFYIEYGPVGFVRGSGSWAIDTIKAAGVQYSLSGLNQGTVYDFFVGTICQTGVDSIEYNESGRFSTIYKAPYETNFDTITAGQITGITDNAWSFSLSTGPQWTVDKATGTDQKTTLTGPHYDHTNFNTSGGGFAYLESSTGSVSVRDSIHSPWVDISSLSTPYIDFYYHMYGSNIGDLITMVIDSAGNSSFLDTISGQQQTSGTAAWIKRTVSLKSFKNSSKLKVVFLGKKNGDKSDMAIDDFSIYDKETWDLKLESFISPSGVCSDSFANVTVAIKNNSTKTIYFNTDSCVVSVNTTGATNLSFSKTIKTDSLIASDTMHVNLTSNYNKAIIGTHNFIGKVVLLDDPVSTNDTLSIQLMVDTATQASLTALSNSCANGSEVTLMGSGIPAGGTSVYSGNGVSGNKFNPASAGKGTHAIKLTYTDTHGCIDTVSQIVTVDSIPVVVLSALPTLCKGGAAITLNQGTPIGGVYSGNNVSSGSYNPLSYGGDTVTYSFTDGNNCSNSDKAYLKVDSVATVSFPTLSKRCLNAGALTLNTATPAGGTYSGSNVASGVYTPVSAGVDTIKYVLTGTGNCKDSASQTITIDSVPTVSFAAITPVCVGSSSFTLTGGSPSGGTYSGNNVTSGSYNPSTVGTDTLSYSFTDGNSCTAIAKSYVVVNSSPTVSFASLSNVCEGSSSFALTGGSPTGGSYSGNNVSSGSYNPITVGKDTLKYVYTNSNSCTDSATSVITVNAKPVISFPALTKRCLNSGSFTLNTATPSGGTYSGKNVTSGLYTPSASGLDTVKYSYTNSNMCTDSASQTITIDSVPIVTFAAISSVCMGSSSFVLVGGSPNGGVYSGNNVSSGSYNPVTSGTDTIRYSFTDGNSCSDSAMSVVRVDTLPLVSLGSFSAICKGASPITLTSGSPSGGTYFGQNVALNLFAPFNSGVDTIHYTYRDGNNCSDTATQTIVVDTIPSVSLSTFSNVCANTPAFVLSGGSPLGGTYSGSNVSSGMYTASMNGTDTIRYEFTDLNNCKGEASSLIQVDTVPVVGLNLGFSQTCENSGTTVLSGGTPMGGTYEGQNVSGNNFDPSIGIPSASIVYYLFVDGNNCQDSAQNTIQIDSIQKVTLASFGTICKLSDPELLIAGSPVGGVYSGGFVNSTTSEFDPKNAPLGVNSINYTFTTPKGCMDSAKGDLIVEANPSFNLGNDTAICGSAQLTLDIGLPFMKYQWSTGDTSRSIKIQKSAIVIAEVTDTATMANCTFSDTIRVDYDAVCVGLNEIFAGASIKYYPNPSDGHFYLELNNIDLENLNIQLISMDGKIRYNESLNIENGTYSGLIEVSELPSGVYMMNLISENGIISKRISIR